jgi:hypothetical protein
MKIRIATSLALPLLFLAFAAGAQTTTTTLPFDVELGYRWVSVGGSNNTYRTMINDREGLILRAFRMSSTGLPGTDDLVDHFRVSASDLGSSPSGGLSIETGKSELWKLRLVYRQADAFSVIPGYVNPLAGLGPIPTQQTWDRTQRTFDFDLEFLPGRRITPFIGYGSHTYDGPGTTTYAFGQDEFLLSSRLDDKEHEIRGGVAFNAGMFRGVVTQGWRQLDSNESLTLAPNARGGNNPGPVIGRPVEADIIRRESDVEVTTPFTNAYVTAQVMPRMRVIGNFSRFAATSEGSELEDASGSFASFRLSRFFGAFDESSSSRAKNTTLRGGLRAEYGITDTIDLLAGWRTDRRDLSGTALIDRLFRNTVNFSGADPRDVRQVIDANSSMERDENIAEIGIAARALGPFTVRASFMQTSQDVTVRPDLSEIVVDSPNQGGSFDRRINTIDLTGAFTMARFTVAASLRTDSADDPVLRTDFTDRDRYRLRASYTFPRNVAAIGATAEQLDQSNELGFDSELRQVGIDVNLTYFDPFRFRAAWSRYDADTRALIRRPENLAVQEWRNLEDGNSVEAGFSVLFRPISVDADFARFDNEGSRPFDIDRYRMRVVWDFRANAGVAAEWSQDKYSEALFPTAAFDAKRYGLFFRWRQQ